MPLAQLFLLITFLFLTACSGGGGKNPDPEKPGPPGPLEPIFSISALNVDTASKVEIGTPLIQTDIREGNFFLEWDLTVENTKLKQSEWYFSTDKAIGSDDTLILTDTQCTTDCASSCQLTKAGKLTCGDNEVSIDLAMGQTKNGFFLLKSCSTDDPTICDTKGTEIRLTIEDAPVIPKLTIDDFSLDTGNDSSEIITNTNSGDFSLRWAVITENTDLDNTKIYFSNDQNIGNNKLIATDTQCTDNCISSCQLVKSGKLVCDDNEVNLNMTMGQTQDGFFLIKSCSTDNPEVCDTKSLEATLTIEDAPIIPNLTIDSVSLNNGSDDGSEIITDVNNGNFSLGWALTLENTTLKQSDWSFSVDQILDENDKKILTDSSCTTDCVSSCQLSKTGKLSCEGGVEVDLGMALSESKAGFFLLKSCSQNNPEICTTKTISTTLTIEQPPTPIISIDSFSIETGNDDSKVRSDENDGNFSLSWALTIEHAELTHSTLYYSDDNLLSDDDRSADTKTQCLSGCRSSCQLTPEGKLNCGGSAIDLAMTPDETKNGHFILESCSNHKDLGCVISALPVELFVPAVPSITITQFSVTSQAANDSDPAPIHHGADSGKFSLLWNITAEHTTISHREFYFSTDNQLSDDDLAIHNSSCGTNCQAECRLTSANRLSCADLTKHDIHDILQTANETHLILQACNQDKSLCETASQKVAINQASSLEAEGITLTPFKVTTTSDALIDLKSIDTLIQLKDQYDLSANEDLGVGQSNLIGVTTDKSSTFPYAGFSDVKIVDLVVNPINQLHYFEIGKVPNSENPLGYSIIDSSSMNVIGASTLFPVNFCENKPCSQYETVDRISSSCPEGSIYNSVASKCVTHIIGTNNGGADEIRVETLFNQIQDLFKESHLACKFVEVDPRTNAYRCLGGNETVDATLRFKGFEIPIQVNISKLIYDRDDKLTSTGKQYRYFKLNQMAFNEVGDIFTALKQSSNNGGRLIIREYDQNTSDLIEVDTGLQASLFTKIEAVLTGDQILLSGSTDGLLHNGEFTELNMNSISADNFVFSFGDSALVKLSGFSYNLIQTNNDGRVVKIPLTFAGNKVQSIYNNQHGDFSVDFTLHSVGRVNLYPFKRQPVNSSPSTTNLKENYEITLDEYNYLDIIPAKYFTISNWERTQTIELLKNSDDIPYGLDITNSDIKNNVLKFTAKRLFSNAGFIYGEIDLLAAFAGEPQENYLSITDKNEAFAQTLLSFHTVDKTAKSKLEAPSIVTYHFDTHEYSQIGVEFSEPMDKASVKSAIRLTRGDEQVEFISAWLGNSLFILPDTLPLNAVLDTYQGFLYNTEYTLTIDPFTAKDLNGQMLSDSIDNPNTITKAFTFGHVNGFVVNDGIKLEESDFAQGKTAFMLNAYLNKRVGKPLNSSVWDHFHQIENTSDTKRYYEVINFIYAPNKNYRFEFDVSMLGSTKWGIGVGKDNASMVIPDQTSGLFVTKDYWYWDAIGSRSPFLDIFDGGVKKVLSPVIGFSKNGVWFNPHPSGNDRKLEHSQSGNKWQRYRFEIREGIVYIYEFNPDNNTFDLGNSHSLSGISNNQKASIWMAFLSTKANLKNLAINQLDNLTFSTIKNENDEWLVDEILEHTDFEDESDPFKGFTGLKQTATKEITPLKLLED